MPPKINKILFSFEFNRFPTSKRTKAGTNPRTVNPGSPENELRTIEDVTDTKAKILKHLADNNIVPTTVHFPETIAKFGGRFVSPTKGDTIFLTFNSNDESQLAHAILDDPE